MKKRIIALLLVAVFLLTFTACGTISAHKAQQIAAKDAGIKVAQAENIHTHVETAADGTAYFSIHFSADGQPYTYMISATGEIMSVSNEAAH